MWKIETSRGLRQGQPTPNGWKEGLGECQSAKENKFVSKKLFDLARTIQRTVVRFSNQNGHLITGSQIMLPIR